MATPTQATERTLQCSRCRETKPEESFSRNGQAACRNYRSYVCQACNRSYLLGYYDRNTDKIKRRARNWAKENPERHRNTTTKADLAFWSRPQGKAYKRIKDCLWRAIRQGRKTDKVSQEALRLLGVERMSKFIRWIEMQWEPGMNWDNYSPTGWHIDHKVPVSTFDLTDDTQALLCFHYTNCRPLWAKVNNARTRRIRGLRAEGITV